MIRMPPEEPMPDPLAPGDGIRTSSTGGPVSVLYELVTRPEAARRAEFLRFRLRFIADQECEVSQNSF